MARSFLYSSLIFFIVFLSALLLDMDTEGFSLSAGSLFLSFYCFGLYKITKRRLDCWGDTWGTFALASGALPSLILLKYQKDENFIDNSFPLTIKQLPQLTSLLPSVIKPLSFLALRSIIGNS